MIIIPCKHFFPGYSARRDEILLKAHAFCTDKRKWRKLVLNSEERNVKRNGKKHLRWSHDEMHSSLIECLRSSPFGKLNVLLNILYRLHELHFPYWISLHPNQFSINVIVFWYASCLPGNSVSYKQSVFQPGKASYPASMKHMFWDGQLQRAKLQNCVNKSKWIPRNTGRPS